MKKDAYPELFKALSGLSNVKEVETVLNDLLTKKEVGILAQRLQIVKGLMAQMSHRTVAKSMKVSISKVTRGVQAVKKSKGGFAKIAKKLRWRTK